MGEKMLVFPRFLILGILYALRSFVLTTVRLAVKCGALTVFHVGCLLNKEDVQRFRAKPRFKVLFQVTYSISKPDLEWINTISRFEAIPYEVRILADDAIAFPQAIYTYPY